MGSMHDDQISITHEQVAALVADQLPALAGHEIIPVTGAGTVNAVFRIGDGVAARFPLRPDDPERLRSRLQGEMDAAAEFGLACPAPAPEPLFLGSPGRGYPLPWTVQSWLDGSPATPTSCANSPDLAIGLAEVIEHLRRWDTRGRRFRGTGRGGALSDHDAWVGECITRSDGLLDTDAMRSMWSRFRLLPNEAPEVMCHGDLIPSNVLVDDGRLTGVLDTGGFGAADPALDLVGAWHLLDAVRRDLLRHRLGCSDLEWERGKAWAFQQAAGAYWYYRHSNPAMADMGRTTLDRLIADDHRP
jgi:aminoglycoside phosphotransferase (APT) family kinase protein